jgi:capsule polysaccharide export protein KpsC/LpsZ
MFKEYYKMYEEMSQEQRQNINISFEKLFELVMFMRGWSPGQSYPITIAPYSDNHTTEKNTIESLVILDDWNSKTNGFLYSLPLITWKNEFVKSTYSDQGFTIGDRIEIVKNGESENINSCIRLTSNVLGASYCFYCKLFKIEENFDIKKLSYIS